MIICLSLCAYSQVKRTGQVAGWCSQARERERERERKREGERERCET